MNLEYDRHQASKIVQNSFLCRLQNQFRQQSNDSSTSSISPSERFEQVDDYSCIDETSSSPINFTSPILLAYFGDFSGLIEVLCNDASIVNKQFKISDIFNNPKSHSVSNRSLIRSSIPPHNANIVRSSFKSYLKYPDATPTPTVRHIINNILESSTLLHYACLNDQFHIVRLLLEHGANPNIVNKGGKGPEFYVLDTEDLLECVLLWVAELDQCNQHDLSTLVMDSIVMNIPTNSSTTNVIIDSEDIDKKNSFECLNTDLVKTLEISEILQEPTQQDCHSEIILERVIEVLEAQNHVNNNCEIIHVEVLMEPLIDTSSTSSTIDEIVSQSNDDSMSSAEAVIDEQLEEVKVKPYCKQQVLREISPWRNLMPFHPAPYRNEAAGLRIECLEKFSEYLNVNIDISIPVHVPVPISADVNTQRHKSALGLALNWQLRVAKQGVTVWTSPVNVHAGGPGGGQWQAIKAEKLIHADKVQILKLLTDDSRLKEYDDMLDFTQFISAVDGCTVIKRVAFKGIWPTAPRDFVTLSTWHENEDGSLCVASRSAEECVSQCSPRKGFVRGFVHVSGYYIQPQPQSQSQSQRCCKVTLIAHTELGGTLPVSIINMLATSAPIKLLLAIDAILKV